MLRPTINYRTTQEQLFLANTVVWIALLLLSCREFQPMNSFFGTVAGALDYNGFQLPILIVVFALLGAGFFRVFRVYNLISDILRIREHFELDVILIPMLSYVGFRPSSSLRNAVRIHRRSLVNELFFRYASSTDGKCLIDRHLVSAAIDQWKWFWFFTETLLLLVAEAVFLWIAGSAPWAFFGGLFCLLMLLVMRVLYGKCKSRATDEVEAILLLNEAAKAIQVSAQRILNPEPSFPTRDSSNL